MKFDLKALLAILTVAASVLAGIAGVVWFVVGLAIAPLDERLSALKEDVVTQGERIVALGERTDRRFAEQAASLASLRESVAEIKGGLLTLMRSKWQDVSLPRPAAGGSPDGQAVQSSESLRRNS